MTDQPLKNYIDGQFVAPETQGSLDVENPTTAESIAEVPLSAVSEIDRAVAAAAAAFPTWSTTPVARRCEFLFKLS